MIRVLFICHGNICRSPMAEFVMKNMAAKAGQAERFEIASAATSTEEIGNPVYPPARRKLAEHGIGCAGKVSLLMDHTARPGDVADPWYTGDFDATWRDVTEGCAALLEELKNKI